MGVMLTDPRRRFLSGSGEIPGHEDDSPDAVAYRARLGAAAHAEVAEIKVALRGVLDRWDASAKATRERWETAGKVGKWAGGLVGGALLLALVGWLLTLPPRVRLEPPTPPSLPATAAPR